MQGRLLTLTKPQTNFLKSDKGEFDFENLTYNDTKAVCFTTGFGGGKTFVLCIKLVELALKYPNHDILYLMPTFSMFRDVLFPSLHELLDDTNISLKINKTTGEINIGDGIGRVILKSMDTPESIVGMNVIDTILDELDTIPLKKAEQVWIKAIARCRKAKKILDEDGNPIKDENGEYPVDEDGKPILDVNRMWIGSTPEGMRFLHKMFVKAKPDNYKLIQASGYDNIYLPKDYYDNLKAIYPDHLVEAYIYGKFVNMSTGNVYTNFDRDACNTPEVHRPNEVIYVSMDFNVQNCNSVIFVKRGSLRDYGKEINSYQYNDKSTLHAVDHLHGILDTPTTIQALQDKYPGCTINCFPDSSGKNASTRGFSLSDISLLKKAGFIVRYPKRNPAIMNRVLATNSALKTGLVKVNVEKCPKLAEALEEQAYSESTGLPEKFPGASIDDVTDSFGYIVHFLFPINRKSFSSSNIRET